MKAEMLSRTQKQMERDQRTFKKVYALVMEQVFPYKKFIKNQQDLDDITNTTSLGKLVMDKMKIDQAERFPFWNAYKEIVADAIANRRTIVSNELKKIVMSKKQKGKTNCHTMHLNTSMFLSCNS